MGSVRGDAHAGRLLLSAAGIAKLSVQSLATKTVKTYTSAGNKFLSFWEWHSGQPRLASFDKLPVSASSEWITSAFVAWAVDVDGIAPESARNYVMGVRTLFKLMGRGRLLSVMKDSLPSLVITGAKNAYPERRAPAKRAVTVAIVRRVVRWVRYGSDWPPLVRALFAALMLIDITTGHRMAELLYDRDVQLGSTIGAFQSISSDADFQPASLARAMQQQHQGPWALTTFDTKTRKRGEPFLSVIVNVGAAPDMCPATALREYWGARVTYAGIRASWSQDSLMFVDETGQPMSTHRFRKLFHSALDEAGIEDGETFTPHGMRVGAATALAAVGIPADVRAAIIGWAATANTGNVTMLSRYTRLSLETVVRAQRAIILLGEPVTQLELTTAAQRARPKRVQFHQ